MLGFLGMLGCAETVSSGPGAAQDVPLATDVARGDAGVPQDVPVPTDVGFPPDLGDPGGPCRTSADCGRFRCVFSEGCATGVVGRCMDTAGCASLPVAQQFCGCDFMTFTVPSACAPDRPFLHRYACEGADAGPPRDVAPPTSPYADAWMVWQAPGGFAGTGPAVLVRGSGEVQTWASVSGFDPSGTPPAGSTRTTLGFGFADALFAAWNGASTALLPHGTGTSSECYPTVSVRLCATCVVQRHTYNSADQLLPELRQVFDWFARNVPGTNPERFCRF